MLKDVHLTKKGKNIKVRLRYHFSSPVLWIIFKCCISCHNYWKIPNISPCQCQNFQIINVKFRLIYKLILWLMNLSSLLTSLVSFIEKKKKQQPGESKSQKNLDKLKVRRTICKEKRKRNPDNKDIFRLQMEETTD